MGTDQKPTLEVEVTPVDDGRDPRVVEFEKHGHRQAQEITLPLAPVELEK